MAKQGTEVDIVTTDREATGNGRELDSPGYDQRVLPSSRPSRREVESRLASTSESISDRISVLQREVVGTGEAVRRFLTDNPWLGAGAALLAGTIVGFLFTPRSRRVDQPDRGEESVDELAAFVTRSVRSAIEEGSDPTHSVATVLERVRQVPPKAPKSNGSLVRTLGTTLLSVAVREVVRRLSKD